MRIVLVLLAILACAPALAEEPRENGSMVGFGFALGGGGAVGADVEVRFGEAPMFFEVGAYFRPILAQETTGSLTFYGAPVVAGGLVGQFGGARFKSGFFARTGVTLLRFRELWVAGGYSGRLFLGKGSRFAFDFDAGPGWFLIRDYPAPYVPGAGPLGDFLLYWRVAFRIFPGATP